MRIQEERVRVAYLLDSLEVGGAEHHVVRIARAALSSGRYLPFVYCMQRTGRLIEKFDELGIEVAGPRRLWSSSPSHAFRGFAQIYRWLREVQPALAHCFPLAADLVAAPAAWLAGVPALISTRRTLYDLHGKRNLYYRMSTGLADRLADRVLTVCEASRQQAIREGIPAAKVLTIRNGVQTVPSTSLRTGMFDGFPIFGSVGRLNPAKGYEVLVRTIPSVLRDLPDSRFVIAGEGPERPRLEDLAAQMGVADRIVLLGDRRDVVSLMPEFDVYVQPSFMEGIPNALLEAMAAGLPVVASSVGGVPEVTEAGTTALLVPPGDVNELMGALVRLGSDRCLQQSFGESGRKMVSDCFSVEREAAETLAVYEELL